MGQEARVNVHGVIQRVVECQALTNDALRGTGEVHTAHNALVARLDAELAAINQRLQDHGKLIIDDNADIVQLRDAIARQAFDFYELRREHAAEVSALRMQVAALRRDVEKERAITDAWFRLRLKARLKWLLIGPPQRATDTASDQVTQHA